MCVRARSLVLVSDFCFATRRLDRPNKSNWTTLLPKRRCQVSVSCEYLCFLFVIDVSLVLVLESVIDEGMRIRLINFVVFFFLHVEFISLQKRRFAMTSKVFQSSLISSVKVKFVAHFVCCSVAVESKLISFLVLLECETMVCCFLLFVPFALCC